MRWPRCQAEFIDSSGAFEALLIGKVTLEYADRVCEMDAATRPERHIADAPLGQASRHVIPAALRVEKEHAI
jgi:hypothetical protein